MRIDQLASDHQPQAAALTKSEGLLPRCACQSPPRSLSRISASRVAASGMRSKASARHISATPSCEDRELLQQALHQSLASRAGRLGTQLLDQPLRMNGNLGRLCWGQGGGGQQPGHGIGLGHAGSGGNGLAQCVGRAFAVRQHSEGRHVGAGVKEPGRERVRGLHHVHSCIASGADAAVYIGKIIAGLLKNESLY